MRRRADELPRKSGGRTIDAPDLISAFRQKELSRRALVKGALAGSAALVGGPILGCSSDGSPSPHGFGPIPKGDGHGDGGVGDAGVSDDGGATDGEVAIGAHLVGMGYSEDDYLAALDAALAETIGLSFISPGDTVYFKVNCNNGDLYPHSTQPLLIEELARRCRDLGAERLIVGDRSFWGDPNTLRNMEMNQVAEAARNAEAELVVFDDDTVDWVAFTEEEAPGWNGGFRLPVPVVEADHIINLPLIKTHFITTFTMSLKNALGLVHPIDRAREGNLDVHRHPNIYYQNAQVNQFLTPSLNILDGYYALITGGPTRREPPGPSYADPRVFIVSTDRIATDVTGVSVLQTLSPSSEEVTQTTAWNNPQIRIAAEHDLGISGPEQYDLSGPTVPMIETYREYATAT